MIHNGRPRPITTDQLRSALHDLPGAAIPDYENDILLRVARTRQRPAWTFFERWIPMPISLRLAVVPRALVILLLLLGLILAMTLGIYTVGSRSSDLSAVALPPPAGLAGNGLIAYGSAGDIWVSEADGSKLRQFTNSPSLEFLPYWSPDGTRLAYWSQDDRSAASRLIVVNADGIEPMAIATQADGSLPIRTDWSPDGTRLAYSACTDGTGPSCASERIFVAAADGSGSEQVGDPELGAAKPDWSPDGQWIAFQGTPADGSEGPFVMAADGSDVRRLEQLPDGEDSFAYFVDWAPNGRGIVTQGSDSVYYVSAADDEAITLAPGGIAFWSPDGEWIVYDKNMDQLALVSADGAESRDFQITSPGGYVWSPDATKLAVFRGGAYSGSLDILDAASGDVLATIPAPDQSYPDFYTYPSWQRVAS